MQLKPLYSIIILSTLIFYCHTCLCFQFYLGLNNNNIYNYKTFENNCLNKTEPCSSVCEIVNFINKLSVENEIIIDIYFLTDFSFEQNNNCKVNITNALTIQYFGNDNYNEITKLNIYQDPFYFGNINSLSHYNLQLSYLTGKFLVQKFKLNYYYCIFDNDISLTLFKNLIIHNSIIKNNIIIENVENVEIVECQFQLNSEFNFIDNIAVANSTFYGKSEEDNTEKRITSVSFNYCKYILIINCKSFIIVTITGNFVQIQNLHTNNSVLIMNAEDAHITNSIFYETKLLALKLIDVEFINLSDNQFENCNSALAVKYTFSSPFQVQISKTNFINNKASATGGAIGFFTIGQGVIEISGCLMEGNKANLGGAIYIENIEEKAILTVYNSQFINNTVRSNGLETPQTIGNGGAIFAICKEIHLINSLFKDNVAVRGGAIFTESYMIMLNSKLIENVGEYSGGGLYTNNLNTLRNLNLNYFENNRNEFYGYGPQIATNAYRMDLTFKVNDELVDEIIIFPGQPFTVSLQLQDFVGNNITTLPVGPEFGFPTYEDGFVVKPLYTNDFFIYEFTVLQSPNFTLTEDTVFISQNIMVYQQATTYFNITIIDCPSDYERLMNENDLLYCQLKVFPLQSIIIIVVCVASVFFIIGIGFGILFIYCCVNITSKLRKLKKKEKAELEIEKRIIDKKIVFGNSDYNDDNEYYNDDNVSLLKDFKKKKSKTKASFSIPIEEILLEKKIGEGGCGTVYCAKWGENLVAIKSIKILDDDDDDNTQNEDFEREVSLLSSLRHPNIVSFYGVTITEKTKYMVIEYLSKGSLKQVIYYSKIVNSKQQLKKEEESLYDILGIKPSSSQKEIKKAFRNLVKKFHLKKEDYLKYLKAYEILIDEKKREKYDNFGIIIDEEKEKNDYMHFVRESLVVNNFFSFIDNKNFTK
ncbi:hypothetical protein ABK040_015104 [Willaertia magna]